MKKLLFIMPAMLVMQAVIAQVKEGIIVYERKVNIHRRITDESQKAMIPEFNTSKVQLVFSGNESSFKNLPEDEDIRDNAGEGNRRFVIRFGGADNEIYKNYSTEKVIELREMGPKKYIIEDSLPRQSWKLDEETKTVKGYTCKKAIAKNKDGGDIIAWYTEDIQSPAGPEQFGGLPGTILELNINDAEIVFTALDINTKDFDPKSVKAPANGKKIARKDFQKMLDDEFGPNPGGKPVIRIMRD
jgi:GLPGLI family protein